MNQNAGIRNKLILWTLCLCLALGAAFAAAEPAEYVAEVPAQAAETVTPAITDAQAAAGFITQVMTGRKLTPPKPRGTVSGDLLTGREALLYAALKERIKQVAAGKLSNTNFQIPVRDVFENSAYSSVDELTELDFDLVIKALLYDLPYDLYWFDKTTGNTWDGLSYMSKNGSFYIYDYENATMNVSFYVSADYSQNGQSGTFVYNTSYGARAVTAAENARSVVDSNADKTDLHKLQAYKKYICDHVDYNHDAVNNGAAYGDPWQLVNVFDGDDSTKVVCEGYSKAFQFLCDESSFSGTSVISVSGMMAGGTGEGPHMWNIVTMGGRHYMADITNSDAGTVGAAGGLFLNGYTEKVSDQEYIYATAGGDITYTYDPEIIDLLGETGRLAVAADAEKPAISVSTDGYIGGDVTVTVSGVEPARRYMEFWWLDGPNGPEMGPWDSYMNDTETYLGLAFLEAGDYEVWLYEMQGQYPDPDTDPVVASAAFTLQSRDLPAASVTVSGSEIMVGENLTYTIPGADAVADHLWMTTSTGEELWGTNPPWTYCTQGNTDTLPTANAGILSGEVWGRFNGVWSPAVALEDIRIQAENGIYPISLEIPDPWTAGQTYALSWTPLEGVENQHITLQIQDLDEEEDDPVLFEASLESAGTFIIQGDLLSDSGHYWMYISAGGDTYEDNVRSVNLNLVTNPARPAAPSVTVDPEQPETAKPLWFVTAQSYDVIQATVWFRDDAGRWGEAGAWNERQFVDSESQYGSLGSHDPVSSLRCTCDLYAGAWKARISVRQDGLWSEPTYLFFDVDPSPKLGNVTLAETIGEIGFKAPFSVKINAVEHATRYWAGLMLKTEESEDGSYVSDTVAEAEYEVTDETGDVITLNFTDWSEAATPGTYWMAIDASADGYETSEVYFWNLNVVESTEPAVYVPGTVALGEGLTVNVRNIPDGNRYVEYILVGDEDGIMAEWNTIQAPGSEYTIGFPQQMLDAQSYTLTVSLNADEYGEDEESKIIFEKTITVTSDAAKTGASLERNSFTAGSSSVPILLDSAAEEVWIQYGPAQYDEFATTKATDPANPALSLSGFLNNPGAYRLRVSAVTDGVRHPYSDWLNFEVHTLTAHAAVPATCEAEGTAAYWKCSECGKLFADENGTTEITAPAVLPKTAHTLIAREAVPSTCDREGTAAYWECSVCEKMFADENGTTEINEPAALPKTAHTLIAHPEVPATAETDGTAAYWECSACGKLFADEYGVTEITAPQVLPKTLLTLTFDRTSGQPGDTVYATITAPGATQIRVTGIWGQVECYELKDGQTVLTVPVQLAFYDLKDLNGNLRGRTFGASALVDGVWGGTATQTLHTVERPDFGDTPFRIAPTTLAAGEDLVIEFLPVEGITNYYITNDAFIENLDAPGTLTIPASLFYQGGSFSFDCGAGDEYAGDLLIKFVKVTAEPYTEAEPLTVTADKTNVASGEKVTFSLGGKQATRIYVQSRSDTGTNYWYDYSRESAPGDSAAGSFEIPIHGSAEYRISALVNGKWTDWSQPVAITATSGGSQGGELTNPDFTVIHPWQFEGYTYFISWNAVEHAETYKVIWQGASSGSLVTAETSARIPARELPAGDYYITVVAEAENYWNESARVWKPFTIVENTEVSSGLVWFDALEIIHGDPVKISYDFSDYEYDVAELRLSAWFKDDNVNYHRYEYDPIELGPDRTGSFVFKDTGVGDYLEASVALYTVNENGEKYLVEEIYPTKSCDFLDRDWQKPSMTLSVTYSAAAVEAGTPISAQYKLSGGTGNYKEIQMGWTVDTGDDPRAIPLAGTWWEDEASGTLTMEAPSVPGRHYVCADVRDSDGWHYMLEDRENGVMVTGDTTDEPLAIDLTFRDEDGNVLNWETDRASVNQTITMEWKITGGYSAYGAHMAMNLVQGSASFENPEYAGQERSCTFTVGESEQDLQLEIIYSDVDGRSKTTMVTIPMAQPEPLEPAVEVPETVALGEGLTVNVRNIPAGNRYVEYILVGDGDHIMADWNTIQAPGSEYTIRFPQQMLDAQSYTLTVSLNADEFGEDEDSKIIFEKTITVTSAAEKTGASLESDSFTAGSSAVPILLDSAAEEVWIQYGPARYAELGTTKASDPANPALSLSGMLGDPGEYRLRVSAVTDGVRHPYSDWLYFEVLSQTPTDPLEVVLTYEEWFGRPGETVHLSFDITGGVPEYEVSIGWNYQDGCLEKTISETTTTDGHGTLEYVIPEEASGTAAWIQVKDAAGEEARADSELYLEDVDWNNRPSFNSINASEYVRAGETASADWEIHPGNHPIKRVSWYWEFMTEDGEYEEGRTNAGTSGTGTATTVAKEKGAKLCLEFETEDGFHAAGCFDWIQVLEEGEEPLQVELSVTPENPQPGETITLAWNVTGASEDAEIDLSWHRHDNLTGKDSKGESHEPHGSMTFVLENGGYGGASLRVKDGRLERNRSVTIWVEDAEAQLDGVTLAEPIGNIKFKAPFSVKINPVENATRYWASLMLETESDAGSTVSMVAAEARYEVTGETGDVITLNFTDWSEAATLGTYWMAIDAAAEGYETSEVYFWNLDVGPTGSEPTLTLPAGLTAIEAEAFAGTLAEAVVIPETVTDIDPTAFDGSAVVYIYGEPGSAAEDFAREHGLGFVSTN